MRRIGIVVLLFAIGWTGVFLLSGDEAPPDDTGSTASTASTGSTGQWSAYRQHPRDDQPTIIHAGCPDSERTETEQRIRPGEGFLLRDSSCPPYQGRTVVEVLVPQPDGSEVRGYAVKFDSFEPVASSGDAPTLSSDDTTTTQSAAAEPLGSDSSAGLPIMVDYRNYRSDYGAALVYAWYTDAFLQRANSSEALRSQLAELQQLDAPNVEKMLMISSYDTLQRVLREYDDTLKGSGVTIIGYNTERSVGTPEGEMQALGSVNGNSVARVAELADQHGYRLIWGPIRNTVDAVSDDAIRAMVDAGLDGVALQEQKFIERSPVSSRVQAVEATAARYKRIGGPAFHVSVQIMPSRCPSSGAGRWDTCAAFVSQIAGTIDSVAIWASGGPDRSALPDLITSIQ